MRKADSAALTRPKVTAPVGTFVAVLLSELVHEQGLRPISKSNHADLANVDHNYESHHKRPCSEGT